VPNVATLAYSVSPSSVASAAIQTYAVPSLGMEAVYENDRGVRDPGCRPLVLGIKNSGADAAYLPLVATTNVAVIRGLSRTASTRHSPLPTG
jgi:hypothetical protein